MQIKKLTNIWAQSTWADQLASIKAEAELKRRLSAVLKELGLFNEKINGMSVIRLPRTAEGNFPKGMDISYAKALDLAYCQNPRKLPILYLLNMAKNFDFKKYSTRQFEGLVARGLRTFPSMLRDRDFAESLDRLLRAGGYKDFEVGGSAPEEDIGKHTDVLLKFRGRLFRIWLYQFSFTGLPHDTDRVLGRRGKLPAGIHVLCPLKATVAMEKETLEKRQRNYAERLEKKREKLGLFSNKACRTAVKCQEELQALQQDIAKNDARLKSVNAIADQEIVTLNWWYFFADQKVNNVIKKIVDILDKKTVADDYSNICHVLEGPEKYLSEIRLFSVKD